MKSTVTRKRSVHYVVSTHWDREWYQTFQDYRRRLVRLLDRVLDNLAAGKLHGPFTLDGQSILLEDYLEIRPERRAQVEAEMKAGRLKAGPWYVLPDEWLVSGESLLRNIRLGRAIARDFGGVPSNAGFVCDLFGHNSQLPQILKGFGIVGGLIWRGIDPRKQAHMIWKGADGTELPCYRFGRTGYCDYTWVRHAAEPKAPFDPKRARADLKTFLGREAARTGDIPPLLLFDGGDHLEYDDDHYGILFEPQRNGDSPYNIKHSTLDEYLEEMLLHRDKINDVIKGELRETGGVPILEDQHWLIPGVLSSRVWIKQANVECQTLLCQWAEPFAALATSFLGAEYPTGYLQVAWKWLLQNHPHDSICGCSIDEVHEDMKYRFAQCRQIALGQTNESLRRLALSVQGNIGPKELRVLVANPLASSLDEPVELALQIPIEWNFYQEFFGFEPKPAFRLYDEAGREIPYQLLRQEMNRLQTRIRPLRFPESFRTNTVTVAVRLQMSALGYRTLTVREGVRTEKDGTIPSTVPPTRYPSTPGLATSERSMENEFLTVAVEMNGTLTLTDKRSGETYSRLLTFEDIADIGDGWYHGLAVNDRCFVSTGAQADVVLVQDGPQLAQFRVRTVMSVPREFENGFRSTQLVPLVIDNQITLRANSDRLEIVTTVENTVKDHRLRVLFPSGTSARTYFADSAFDVVERPVALPADTHLRRELPVETTAQQSWTAVADRKRGLAVIAAGLLETAVRDLPERIMALTLFRATRQTVFTNGQPEGQLQGPLTFRYWLVPVAAGFDRRKLFDYGLHLNAGLRSVQLYPEDFAPDRPPSHLPAQASFFQLDGPAVLSSVRRVDDALEVRIFNPDSAAAKATLDFPGGTAPLPSSAARVDFESNPLGASEAVVKGNYSLRLKAKEIVTLRFEFSANQSRNGHAPVRKLRR